MAMGYVACTTDYCLLKRVGHTTPANFIKPGLVKGTVFDSFAHLSNAQNLSHRFLHRCSCHR